MKNSIFLMGVCLLILFVGASSLARNVVAPPMPQGAQERPRDPQQTCPLISVSCPNDVKIGEPLEFKVAMSGGDPDATPTYNWEVFGGVIIEGQGTPAIKVTIAGWQTVTATLQVGGLHTACAKTASCSIPIHHPFPPAQKFDSYGILPINKEKARLALFAAALKNQPGAQAIIFGYDGPPGPAGEAQKSVDRAKTYLVDNLGIEQSRIVNLNGGLKGQHTIDLYLVPARLIPPTAEPTPAPPEVKPMKATAKKSVKPPLRN